MCISSKCKCATKTSQQHLHAAIFMHVTYDTAVYSQCSPLTCLLLFSIRDTSCEPCLGLLTTDTIHDFYGVHDSLLKHINILHSQTARFSNHWMWYIGTHTHSEQQSCSRNLEMHSDSAADLCACTEMCAFHVYTVQQSSCGANKMLEIYAVWQTTCCSQMWFMNRYLSCCLYHVLHTWNNLSLHKWIANRQTANSRRPTNSELNKTRYNRLPWTSGWKRLHWTTCKQFHKS